jgi:hypothetical protein
MDAHFTGVANDVIAWTIRQLNTDSLTYLERLPYAIEIPFDAIGVHASLDYPERFFYMLPKNSGVRHLLKTFGSLDDERVCFTGHTHLEAAYSCSPLWIKLRSYFGLINWVAQHAGMNNPIGYSGRIDDNQSFPIDGSLKYVFEVGTVGWHRKPKEEKGTDLLNNPATYVTYDGNTVTYRRVKYDFVSTLRKIEGMGLSKSDTTQLVDKLRGG